MKSERGVAFDMDGVIVDGMHYHVEAWQEVLKKDLKAQVSDEHIYLTEGYRGLDFIRYILAELGLNLTQRQQEELYLHKVEIFNQIFKIESIPGATETVRFLYQMGIPLALVTGTERDIAENVLRKLQIRDCFASIISGEDVEEGKPSPLPYLTAAARLGAAKENILVVENAPLGIQSSIAAGIPCVAILSNLKAENLLGAGRIFRDHTELKEFFTRELKISGGQGKWNLQG